MDFKSIATWALGRSKGASAKCIALHLMGLPADGSYPHDGGDFDRCEALLNAVPELRARVAEMATVNQYWAALAPRWDEIKASHNKFALIQSIIRPKEDADPRIVRLGKNVSLHC